MSLCTLNGTAATKARMYVADFGAWWLDITLAEAVEYSGAVECVFADITAKGTVMSGGVFEGKAAYRVVGGKGKWGAKIARRGYSNDLGVKLPNVLGDAAKDCGETLVDVPATVLGPHYTRPEGPAGKLLNIHAERNWYVDFDGVTHIGKRAATTYTGDGTRKRIDPAGRITEIGTEQIAKLVPGVVIDGSLPATDVEYSIDAKRLTVRVYAGANGSRRLSALDDIVAALIPDLRFYGCSEYRVVDQSGKRLALQPVRSALGMPDLENVPMRPGMAGLDADVAFGELVLVCFADNDPSRPQVFAHDDPDAPGWMPRELRLGEEPTLGIARMTDPVIAGGFGGVITRASTRIKGGL